MVDVLPTKRFTPQQVLLSAQKEQDDMSICTVIWMTKGSEVPRFTCSNMTHIEAYFLGGALQNFALNRMK